MNAARPMQAPVAMEPDEQLLAASREGLEHALRQIAEHDQSLEYHDRERARWHKIADAHRAALEVLEPQQGPTLQASLQGRAIG